MIRSSSRRADHGGSLDFNVSERRLFTVGELRGARVCSPEGELRKRPPTVAALLLGALERFDFAAQLPKLYIMAIYKLLGLFLGGFVVEAEKVHGPDDVIVRREKVSAILSHIRSAPSQWNRSIPEKYGRLIW